MISKYCSSTKPICSMLMALSSFAIFSIRPAVPLSSLVYEKFGSRVGPHIEFRPPDEDEVLTKILPQLLVPHWKYDLSSEADIAMGMELWDRTKPSFRNLRTVLQYASMLTELYEKEWISRDILKQSWQMMASKKYPDELLEEEVSAEEPQTEYEKESERRQDDKANKNQDSI